jgi:archaellum component FlaC
VNDLKIIISFLSLAITIIFFIFGIIGYFLKQKDSQINSLVTEINQLKLTNVKIESAVENISRDNINLREQISTLLKSISKSTEVNQNIEKQLKETNEINEQIKEILKSFAK